MYKRAPTKIIMIISRASFVFPIRKETKVPKNPTIMNGPPMAEAIVFGIPRLDEFIKLA